MTEPKKPRTPTYTTREKIAIRLFGTCKKMNAYAVAMRDYKAACKEWEKYVEQCRYEASIIRTPHTETPRTSIYDRKPFEYARTIGIKGVFEHI